MKFRLRALIGLLQFLCMIALLIGAVILVMNARSNQTDGGRFGNKQAKERSFVVDVITLTPLQIRPTMHAFGEVISTRTLELRPAAAGILVGLSDNFVEGGRVSADDTLFEIDPSSARATLGLANVGVQDAQADYDEAVGTEALARAELSIAQRQEGLRQQALDRQNNLIARGIGTDAALEVAQLASVNAQATTLAKRQVLANAKARIARAKSALGKAQINRDEAARKLADLTVQAEFSGILSEVNAVKGAQINSNDRLGKLIDPNALEVAIRLSNAQFAQLQSGLDDAVAYVSLQGGDAIEVKIIRTGGALNAGATGRQVFAKLPPTAAQVLQTGDFVSVTIQEAPLADVVLIPAGAANNLGQVLLIDADNRLIAVDLPILRKQGDDLIVQPRDYVGARIVKTRAPQLSAGIKVEPRAQGAKTFDKVDSKPDTIALSSAQQEKLRELLAANSKMPAVVKTRLLKQVESGKVPKSLFDRYQKQLSDKE